jgi:hypothetical protein
MAPETVKWFNDQKGFGFITQATVRMSPSITRRLPIRQASSP